MSSKVDSGARVKRSSCNVAADLSQRSLPVAGTGSLSQIRKSKRGKWRAAVLIGVHVVVAAHITYFLVRGRAISPVEPSESMYTLELGYVNAGFIFFAVALLATLVFGRFFCGWACHIVALQDLCGWIMKKLGVRPRPFRSRFLVGAPIALALYMFVWPSFKRIVLNIPPTPFPGFTNHLMTNAIWATFPGPVFAVLTFLTCGFVAVYFLGAKGFCTYACPYGAFFSGIDYLSPGKIVVNDSCEQCGHCTATCTSNVRVHEEVRLYGMVVDSGCMKCMDCVNVCPKGALSFGFAKPSIFKGKAATPRAKRFDLSLAEELGLAAVCLVATLAFRSLYDGPPLLMSVALGSLSAFAALKLWQLARAPGVRIQNLNLKTAGRVQRIGFLFAGLAGVWLLFTAHSAFVQWHRAWGRIQLDRTEATRVEVIRGAHREKPYSVRHRDALAKATRHFSIADRWGLAGVAEIKLGLAWCALLRDDPRTAEDNVRAAAALRPGDTTIKQDLFEVLLAQDRVPEALEVLRQRRGKAAPDAADLFHVAGLLAEAGHYEEAAREYAACVAAAPYSTEPRYNLGGILRRLGRNDEAIAQLQVARRFSPKDAAVLTELGLACAAAGRNEEAIEALERAIALDPQNPESRMHLPGLIEDLRRKLPGAGKPTVPQGA